MATRNICPDACMNVCCLQAFKEAAEPLADAAAALRRLYEHDAGLPLNFQAQ